jgi:hypothetical protein
MLYAFGFDRIGVAVGDLYFVDPKPGKGEEGAEQGVRLELRFLERGELHGSVYSAQPITVERPIWRVDLLESVVRSGSFDRTHHHPAFKGWEPGRRNYVEELTADPLGWLTTRLTHLDEVLKVAGVDGDEVGPNDVGDIEAAAPEIVGAVERLLSRIRAGELAQPPDRELVSARVGWL